jgi:hypothetical protein
LVSASQIQAYTVPRPAGPGIIAWPLLRQHRVPPLGSFTLLSVLNGVQIVNGKIAVIKGTPPISLVGIAKVPPGLATTVLTLCGTIVLGGSDFMNLIHSIVQLDSVDIFFIEGQELRVGIPATSLDLNLFGVFQVKSFTLDFLPRDFGLGADLEIIIPYLPGPPVDPSFSLVVTRGW